MAKIKIVAGDLDTGTHDLISSTLKVQDKSKLWSFNSINLSTSLSHLEIVTEQNKKAVGGTLVGGIAGLALLGPLGAVGGMLLGGNKKKISFVAALADGRQFMGQTDANTYVKMQGWTMARPPIAENIGANINAQEMDSVGYILGVPSNLFDRYIELSKDPTTMNKATALHSVLLEEYPESKFAKRHNDSQAEARVMEKMYDKMYEDMTPEDREAAEQKELEQLQHENEFPQGIPLVEWEEYHRLVSESAVYESHDDLLNKLRIYEDYQDQLCEKYPNSEFKQAIEKSLEETGGRVTKQKREKKGLFSW